MSRVLNYDEKGNAIQELESTEICKWRICDICCNDKSQYLADYPRPFCKCESIEDCKYFEKEDMEWKQV